MTEAEKAYALLSGYTSILVPGIILGLALVGLIVMQVLFTIKLDSILVWIAPIFLGIAGGFSSLATMSYYMSYDDGLKNSVENLNLAGYSEAAAQLTEMCPNFGGYAITFIFLAVIFFSSLFVSFVLAIIKAVKRRNMY